MTDRADPGDSAGIEVVLDAVLADRGMTLTELADRVGVTIVNLSVLKNGGRGPCASRPWAPSAASWAVSPGDLLRYRG